MNQGCWSWGGDVAVDVTCAAAMGPPPHPPPCGLTRVMPCWPLLQPQGKPGCMMEVTSALSC